MTKMVLKHKMNPPRKLEDDSRVMAQFMAKALQGLLSCNWVYDVDAMAFRENLSPEDLVDNANAYAEDLLERYRQWRSIQRFEEHQ
jgi:hypothetical protein